MSIERQVAVITGASQGIGAGLVQGFLDRGYRVVANSRSIKEASGWMDRELATTSPCSPAAPSAATASAGCG
jgi:NAD(P)-dependent dehydrogenase (short-subunit alcohol dehydrogenase family)